MKDIDVSEALDYLASTDETCARAKALMKRLEAQKASVKGLAMLEVEGEKMPVASKEAKAFTSEIFKRWLKSFEDAVADYEIINNKRNTRVAEIEVWRSENANKRRGNI